MLVMSSDGDTAASLTFGVIQAVPPLLKKAALRVIIETAENDEATYRLHNQLAALHITSSLCHYGRHGIHVKIPTV